MAGLARKGANFDMKKFCRNHGWLADLPYRGGFASLAWSAGQGNKLRLHVISRRYGLNPLWLRVDSGMLASLGLGAGFWGQPRPKF